MSITVAESIGPRDDLFLGQRGQIAFVPNPAFASKKLRQRGAAGKSAAALCQRHLDSGPCLASRILDRTRVLIWPPPIPLEMQVRPRQDLILRERRRIVNISDPAILCQQLGERGIAR